MLSLTQRYTGAESLGSAIEQRSWDKQDRYLVRVVTSNLDCAQSLEVAKEIKALLPNSVVVGNSSTDAVILNGNHLQGATIVAVYHFEKLHVVVETFSYEEKTPKQLAGAVHRAFCPNGEAPNGLVHLLMARPYEEVNEFVQATNEYTPTVKLIGGITGDIMGADSSILGFAFTHEQVIQNGLVAFTVTGEEVRNFTHVSTSMVKIGDSYEITKTDGCLIEEIEHQPALDWMYNYLNLDSLYEQERFEEWRDIVDQDYLTHFPIMLEGFEKSGRFTKYEPSAGKLSLYFSHVPSGSRFKMGYVDPGKTVKESHQLCEDILDVPVEALCTYVCLFRKAYLQNCSEWELAPFRKYGICGSFMTGEIAHQEGANTFYNGAAVVAGIAEKEHYIMPNIALLSDASSLQDDLSFIQKAKTLGKTQMKDGQAQLIERIEKHRQGGEVEWYVDTHSGMHNVYQYETDLKVFAFNKICAVESLTADMTIAVEGQQRYYEALRDVYGQVMAALTQIGLVDAVKVYLFNYKTFLIAAKPTISDQKFVEGMRALYAAYTRVYSGTTGIAGVSRFMVLLQQQNMLESALNMLLATRDRAENFLVQTGDGKGRHAISTESKAIELLNYAVNEKRIVPFYQGIYNNRLKTIDRYESLMRIVDADGKIHTPFAFLDVAKRYKFYNKISQMMVERVLEEFRDRTEVVSINISLYDIQSESFRTWFLAQLAQYQKPGRVTVEFVETENYQRVETLVDFVTEIHAIGCKVAIDDFGAGYSNFSTILSLQPDYIKIDGSIIAKIVTSKQDLIVLDTICYLARQMNTKVVAEFVETEEIQQILLQHGVNFSQGYLFAKPQSLAQLQQKTDQV